MLKNITLSADEDLIKKAREKARQEHTTLNDNFRRWLKRYVVTDNNRSNYDDLMNDLDYVKPGRKFSRDELNER
ncbi:MAG: hypothetical protein GF353_09545 [Candidatus Lokiarchaeota archaeon]|nr:hypothetical protein [Candidatus Lokiarchaeota archaeon]